MKGVPMITRRNLFVGVSAALVAAPAIVRAASLMPVRVLIRPIQMYQHGFCTRLYVSFHLPEITRLQSAGLSAAEIATDLSARNRPTFTISEPWDAGQVMGILRTNEQIQQTDLILRRKKYEQSFEA
jgi:hypothetical protein